MPKADEGSEVKQLKLCRFIYANLVKCHSHLWCLTLICRDLKRMDDAVYFSNFIFKKTAKNVWLGGGRFKRYGGTEPFLTDTARLFFRLGLFLSKLKYKNKGDTELAFEAYLRRSYEVLRVNDFSMRHHLVELANYASCVVGDYGRFYESGFSLLYDSPNSPIRLIADKDHYERRTNMLGRLAERCLKMIEHLDHLEAELEKAPPKP